MHKKSPVLRTKKQYVKWMVDNKFFDNVNYYPPEEKMPRGFPLIVVAEIVHDYDGRYRLHQTVISKQDFD